MSHPEQVFFDHVTCFAVQHRRPATSSSTVVTYENAFDKQTRHFVCANARNAWLFLDRSHTHTSLVSNAGPLFHHRSTVAPVCLVGCNGVWLSLTAGCRANMPFGQWINSSFVFNKRDMVANADVAAPSSPLSPTRAREAWARTEPHSVPQEYSRHLAQIGLVCRLGAAPPT
jgi:hypothetical protein